MFNTLQLVVLLAAQQVRRKCLKASLLSPYRAMEWVRLYLAVPVVNADPIIEVKRIAPSVVLKAHWHRLLLLLAPLGPEHPNHDLPLRAAHGPEAWLFFLHDTLFLVHFYQAQKSRETACLPGERGGNAKTREAPAGRCCLILLGGVFFVVEGETTVQKWKSLTGEGHRIQAS
ncbi:hypothetical protein SAY86_030230 [Trapa natans]|uniref:Uncharacterized protein n=1 Tax=Trapa natans TaxID=22666 RepID=A0AAN7M3F9_TRANT|nr:hypothetical protein SAY86_030230 [Trapa natans]